MLRTAALTATTLLGLALVSPTTSHATGETCRGEAATIIGTEGKDVVGTEARDVVVVTNGSPSVITLGGDDLVCVVASPRQWNTVEVDTGTGDDVLDSTGAGRSSPVRAVLGPGADHFEGGSASDVVAAGEMDLNEDNVFDDAFDAHVDTEADVVMGGAGFDTLISGREGMPNADSVLGGRNDDTITYGGPQEPAGLLSGGAGTDRLHVPLPPGDTVVDSRAQLMTLPAGTVAWTTIESFLFRADDAFERQLSYTGTDANDDVQLLVERGLSIVADLEGGDDFLAAVAPLASGDVDGNAGRDHLYLSVTAGSLDLDLGAGVLDFDTGATAGSVAVDGFELANVSGPQVRVAGTDDDDDVLVYACTAVVLGRGGDDLIESMGASGLQLDGGRCRERAVLRGGPGSDRISSGGPVRDTIRGGSGHDRLTGGRGPDRVIGGPGRDSADGGPGPRPDTCRAERETACER